MAAASQLPVYAGPSEATVLGNLGMQFLAAGAISSLDDMFEAIGKSAEVKSYSPA